MTISESPDGAAMLRDSRTWALLLAATQTIMSNATITPALPGLAAIRGDHRADGSGDADHFLYRADPDPLLSDRMAVAAGPHVTGRAGSIVETLGRVGLSGGPVALGLQPAALEIRPVQQPFTQDPRD